jgi:hypothetical protein
MHCSHASTKCGSLCAEITNFLFVFHPIVHLHLKTKIEISKMQSHKTIYRIFSNLMRTFFTVLEGQKVGCVLDSRAH